MTDPAMKTIETTCQVFLQEIDGVRLSIGTITLAKTAMNPKPATVDEFADEGVKQARASLAKLMPHRYRIVVIDEDGKETAIGLERWFKYIDREKEFEMRLQGRGSKQPVRKS